MKYQENYLMELCENQKDGINGIEFLRAAVKWLDYRVEVLNENKTARELIEEYEKFVMGEDE